jgi:hypothetical protein
MSDALDWVKVKGVHVPQRGGDQRRWSDALPSIGAQPRSVAAGTVAATARDRWPT